MNASGKISGDISFWAGIGSTFIPGSSVVLGPIGAVSRLINRFTTPTSMVQAEITAINNELYALNNEVTNLQNEYNNLSSAFNTFVTQQTNINFANAAQKYSTYTNYIGTYSTTTQDGAYNVYSSEINPILQMIKDKDSTAQIHQKIKTAQSIISTNQVVGNLISNYGSTMAAVSGSYVNVPESELASANIYKYVTLATNNSSTSNAYLYNYLNTAYTGFIQQNLPIPYDTSTEINGVSPNFLTQVNAYNTWVISIYKQNIAYLQELYLMETDNNILNYASYISGYNEYICSFEPKYNSVNFIPADGEQCADNVNSNITPGMTEQQASEQLKLAQISLTKLFAARVNVLYQQTISNMIGDSYSYEKYNMIPVNSIKAADGNSVISIWPVLAPYVIYQYPFLYDLNAWKKNIAKDYQESKQVVLPNFVYPAIESAGNYSATTITIFDQNANQYSLPYATYCINNGGLYTAPPMTGTNVKYINPQAAKSSAVIGCNSFNANPQAAATSGVTNGITPFTAATKQDQSFTIYYGNNGFSQPYTVFPYSYLSMDSNVFMGTTWSSNPVNGSTLDFNATGSDVVTSVPYSSSVWSGGGSSGAIAFNSFAGVPYYIYQPSVSKGSDPQNLYLNCMEIIGKTADSDVSGFFAAASVSNEFYSCTSTGIGNQENTAASGPGEWPCLSINSMIHPNAASNPSITMLYNIHNNQWGDGSAQYTQGYLAQAVMSCN